MFKVVKPFLLVGLFAVCLISTAQSQGMLSRNGLGPYMGYSSNPDQVVFGGQGNFALTDSPIHFAPAIDFGFGDDITVTTLNFDITYDFVPSSGKVVFFVGAGPTVAFYSADQVDGSEAGLTLTLGAALPAGLQNSWNFAARIGVGDIPDVKFQFGYLFGLK